MNFVRSNSCFLRIAQSNILFRYTSRSHLSFEIHLPPPHSNISLWNSAIKSCIENKKTKCVLAIYSQMLQSNVKPNDLTFSLLIKSSILSSSSSSTMFSSSEMKREAQKIHTHLLKSGFDRFVYVSTALLDLYSKCGFVFFAHQLFEDMSDRDIISWNALIGGYSYNGYDLDAMVLFLRMLNHGMYPCRATLVSVIPCCARAGLLFQGKFIHGFGIKVGLDSDSRVKNALADMYAKCSDLDATRMLFEEMSEKCVVSWNTMINAYGQNGYFEEALFVFKQMLEEHVGPNSVTIVSLLSANAPLESIHCYAAKTGLDSDASVITSLVCMYSKWGNTEMAKLLYGFLPQKNLISLTAIISSYVEKGNMVSAIECFIHLQLLGMKPDAVAMVSVLHGFKDPTYIESGVCFHGYTVKSGLVSDSLVVNGLISMYSNLNDIEAAFFLFHCLCEKALISWNSMISTFVQAGRWSDAMDLFWQMKIQGYDPDPFTMVSLLSGCTQFGSLQVGRKLHSYILRHNLEVEDFVVTALVDMYAKCGSIEYAERVFKCITNPCLATWNAMILGHGMCGLEIEALRHYSEMVKRGLKPDEITFLGVLSACNHAGFVHEGRRYFSIMREEFGIIPGMQHCACVVDLLGRDGLFDEAVTFINRMDVEADSVVWGALLSACCVHQNIKLGECVAKKIFLLDHRNGGFYVLMSNLYAATCRWDDVARVREMMKDTGGDGCSGISLIESTLFQLSHEKGSNIFMNEINLDENSRSDLFSTFEAPFLRCGCFSPNVSVFQFHLTKFENS